MIIHVQFWVNQEFCFWNLFIFK